MIKKLMPQNFPIMVLALVFTVSYIGAAYSYGFPLFSLSAGLLLALSFIHFIYGPKIKLTDSFDKVFLFSYVFLVCAFLYAWFVFDGGSNHLVEKDSRNLISLTIVLFSTLVLVKGKEEAQQLYKYFSLSVIIFMFPVGLLGLHKIYQLNQGILLEEYFINGHYINGTSLVVDYNFFALSHIFALVFVVILFQRTKNFAIKIPYSIAAVVFFSNIFLSGSRRGLVIIGILALAYGFYVLFGLIKVWFFFLRQRLKKTYIYNCAILLLGLIVIMTMAPKLTILNVQEFDTLLYRASTIMDLLNNNDHKENSFSERTKRWEIAGKLIEGHTTAEKLFGNGFQYHRQVARYSGAGVEFDYPHNLLISLFLSNGILGFIISCFIMLYVLYMSYKIRHEYPDLLLLYGIMLIFILTSGDQWFSIKSFPILIFLVFSIFRHRNSYE